MGMIRTDYYYEPKKREESAVLPPSSDTPTQSPAQPAPSPAPAPAPEPAPEPSPSPPPQEPPAPPEGYRLAGVETRGDETVYKYEIDPAYLEKEGMVKTETGEYSAKHLPAAFASAAKDLGVSIGQGSALYKTASGATVKEFRIDPKTGQITAVLESTQTTVREPTLDEYKYKGFMNVEGAGGIGTDPKILDVTEAMGKPTLLTPISVQLLKFSETIGEGAVISKSSFMDVSGAGGIGTDPEITGAHPITTGMLARTGVNIAAGSVAWGESQVGIPTVPAFGSEAAKRPGYTFGTLAPDIVLGATMVEAGITGAQAVKTWWGVRQKEKLVQRTLSGLDDFGRVYAPEERFPVRQQYKVLYEDEGRVGAIQQKYIPGSEAKPLVPEERPLTFRDIEKATGQKTVPLEFEGKPIRTEGKPLTFEGLNIDQPVYVTAKGGAEPRAINLPKGGGSAEGYGARLPYAPSSSPQRAPQAVSRLELDQLVKPRLEGKWDVGLEQHLHQLDTLKAQRLKPSFSPLPMAASGIGLTTGISAQLSQRSKLETAVEQRQRMATAPVSLSKPVPNFIQTSIPITGKTTVPITDEDITPVPFTRTTPKAVPATVAKPRTETTFRTPRLVFRVPAPTSPVPLAGLYTRSRKKSGGMWAYSVVKDPLKTKKMLKIGRWKA